MTPLPKRRLSTRRQGKRRAALALHMPAFTKCPNCGSLRLPHRTCKNCGYYDGKPVVVKREKKKKS